MKIKTETITLHSFSIPYHILPTFQKARLKSLKGFYFKNPWKILMFKCWENEKDVEKGLDKLVTKIVRVK